jgi:hypothetical protein
MHAGVNCREYCEVSLGTTSQSCSLYPMAGHVCTASHPVIKSASIYIYMENSQLTRWLAVHSHPAIGSFYSVFLTLDLTNAVNGPSIPFLFFPAQPRNRTPLTSILLSLPAPGHQPHTSNPLSSLHHAYPLRPAASSTAWLRTRGTGRIRPGTAAPMARPGLWQRSTRRSAVRVAASVSISPRQRSSCT